ncbi:hypothetical protein Tco_0336206 [Tanacetum coccineum]
MVVISESSGSAELINNLDAGKNKMGFIDDTYVKQESSVVLSQQCERCNAIVLGWILKSLSQELYSESIMYNVNLGWIINSVANQHMTDPTKDIFNVVNIYSLILTVCHPNGTLAKNTAIGSLRLGHLADQVLSILGKKIGFSKSDHISPCDICHKAKQTSEPFPLSDHKSVCVGDLVHCDVLGSLHSD